VTRTQLLQPRELAKETKATVGREGRVLATEHREPSNRKKGGRENLVLVNGDALRHTETTRLRTLLTPLPSTQT